MAQEFWLFSADPEMPIILQTSFMDIPLPHHGPHCHNLIQDSSPFQIDSRVHEEVRPGVHSGNLPHHRAQRGKQISAESILTLKSRESIHFG